MCVNVIKWMELPQDIYQLKKIKNLKIRKLKMITNLFSMFDPSTRITKYHLIGLEPC